ncbi:hypothetical protein LXL04_005877 [Taraxacum kok-saghyz]
MKSSGESRRRRRRSFGCSSEEGGGRREAGLQHREEEGWVRGERWVQRPRKNEEDGAGGSFLTECWRRWQRNRGGRRK